MRSGLAMKLAFVALVCGVLTVVGATTADAAQPVCTPSTPSFYKSGPTIIGKLKISCTRAAADIRVSGAIVRYVGGRNVKQVYRTKSCSASSCLLIMGIPDVKGSQKYTLGFDTTPNGTHVIFGVSGLTEQDCFSTMPCAQKQKTRYF